ncbi:hypothetical protein [Bradyrhizobium sp. LA2.1]|uniref:hypothetical protein n=1 Tax=Bradyrhizobium sp. LA2.1 TaxID=3156376 RepID=UPI003392574B
MLEMSGCAAVRLVARLLRCKQDVSTAYFSSSPPHCTPANATGTDEAVSKLLFRPMVLLSWLAIASLPASAQLQPDKKVASVGKWSVSTALHGSGCVARTEYGDGYELSVSGERIDDLTLLITVNSRSFSTKLDGTEEKASSIEIVLANYRRGNVSPYGYRGTPGVVLKADQAFLGSFVASEKIKVTELGREKVSIDLENPGQVIDALRACLRTGTAPSARTPAASVQALEGKWYFDNQGVCKGRPGETEGLLTFHGMTFLGYENNCRIQTAKPNGRRLALGMICNGEGMQERSSEIIEFLDDRTIRRSSRDGARTYTSVHKRCPE